MEALRLINTLDRQVNFPEPAPLRVLNVIFHIRYRRCGQPGCTMFMPHLGGFVLDASSWWRRIWAGFLTRYRCKAQLVWANLSKLNPNSTAERLCSSVSALPSDSHPTTLPPSRVSNVESQSAVHCGCRAKKFSFDRRQGMLEVPP